jgi:hypothetical protein
MSNNIKVRVYKNPARKIVEAHKPYVPQYQLMGVDPDPYKSPLAPGYPVPMSKTPLDENNTRRTRAAIRQPYAETVSSPVGRGRGPLPNVGNNIEQTWSGVDGEIIDDVGLDPNHPMVDNNEFVSAQTLGVPEEYEEEEVLPTLDEIKNPPRKLFTKIEPEANNIEKTFLTEDVLQEALTSEYLNIVISQMSEDEYLLIVDGSTICSGPLEYIQEQITSLVFGEHELYHGNPVSVDDIIVIKRVPIKVGVFLS